MKIDRYLTGAGEKRQLPESLTALTTVIAVGAALFNIWAVFGYPDALLHRSISFGLFFALTFLLYTTPGGRSRNFLPWFDWLLAGSSLTVSFYIAANLERLITRYVFVDPLFPADLAFGLLTIFLLLEGSRRIIGPWLAALCLAAFGYALGGSCIPGLFSHNGFSIQSVVEELFMTTNGIWGSILGMATTYIAIFIIFGAFLQISGAGDFLFSFASAVAGRSRGGLAKIGVIASALFGMISGSAAANVASVGSVTIPMMKKSGYPSDFAAAVECCASTGGAIMPPVLGSVAFIMAEVTGISYIKIATAAFLPALIYYTALFFTVDFRAGKMGMKGLARKDIPPLGPTLLQGTTFVIPLIYLILRLIFGATPSRAGLEAVLLIITVSWFRKDTRMGIAKTIQALALGSIQSILIIATMAASGILLGIINLTGLGAKFSSIFIAISGQSIIINLLLTMILALFLGLAMNITPSYLLTAVIAAPSLIKLGVPPIAAHLFILFFAAMAPMTPPVATTAFAAAGIAGAEPMRVGFLSMRIAIVAYIMPFIFIYQPALLMQGNWWNVAFSLLLAGGASLLLAAGGEGWLHHCVNIPGRILYLSAGLLLLSGSWPAILAALLLFLSAWLLNQKRFRPRSTPAHSKLSGNRRG